MVEELQTINKDLEEELDNLRNELSVIDEDGKKNGGVHRASVEGFKRSQLERDLRKLTQDKIKLDTDLQSAKETIKELVEYK